jgi:hypothetical protein
MVACALLLGRSAVGAAQDTVPAQVQSPQDSAPQGYAPAEPAPVPAPTTEPAPAGSPEPAVPSAETAAPEPAAAPATASEASIRTAALRSLGFVEILTPRSADRIQQEIEEVKTDQRQAEAEYDEQQGLEGQVKAMVDVKKQELSTLDAQRKLAEKNKQEAEVATFEAEKKDAERHKLFLEKRVSLHQASRIHFSNSNGS